MISGRNNPEGEKSLAFLDTEGRPARLEQANKEGESTVGTQMPPSPWKERLHFLLSLQGSHWWRLSTVGAWRASALAEPRSLCVMSWRV